jgi:hypothetical protein
MWRNSIRGWLIAVSVPACQGARGPSDGDAAPSDAAVMDGGSNADSESGLADAQYPASCFIDRASYDQSCASDSDCIAQVTLPNMESLRVQYGNFCQNQGVCFCGGGAVGRMSVAQYIADVSKTPIGSGELPIIACSCATSPPTTCQNGTCGPPIPSQAVGDAGMDATDANPLVDE